MVAVLVILLSARRSIPHAPGDLHIDTVPAGLAVFDAAPIETLLPCFTPGMPPAPGCSICTVYGLVDTNGTVTSVKLVDSYGHPALDEAAARTACRMRFRPGRYNGRLARVWVRMSYTGHYPDYWAFGDTSSKDTVIGLDTLLRSCQTWSRTDLFLPSR